MPLLKLKDIAKSARLGVWEIKEDEKFFLEQLPSGYLEPDFKFNQFSPRRKLEYLASRFLLFQMTGDEKAVLSKDENGKPFIVNSPLKISVSHTKDLAAVIVSENSEAGLDIETIHERIQRVKHKFLGEKENEFLGENPAAEMLTLCWSAKESIYKWYGKKELSFQNNILLENPLPEGAKWFTGYLLNGSGKKKLKIHYEKINDSILTWILD